MTQDNPNDPKTIRNPESGTFVRARRFLSGSVSAWICLGLFAATLALYWPVHSFPLISIDDPEYVTNDPNVGAGFTADSIRGAFVATGGNWIPVTHLSHMLDYKLFGAAFGYHHLTSVVLHGFAVILLFLFLKRATGALWPSAFLAAVFALHPIHVESVAWVAERKDVLCALFWFLALLLWCRYVERPSVGRYLASLVALLLGIMSKPMIVSFPLLLLVLDFWPFRRPLSRWLLLEKVPAALLVAACSVVTYLAQDRSGAVQSLSQYPVLLRVQNALSSLLYYQRDLLWPADLAFAYPYPTQIPWLHSLAALALLGAITGVAIRLRRSRPYLMAGWLWFLLTVLPVIGLVMVGLAARADRYMYVPAVGLSVMGIWLVNDLASKLPGVRVAVAVVASVAMIFGTVRQLGYWRSSETLYRRALASTGPNVLASIYLARILGDDPRQIGQAVDLARSAVRLRPGDAGTHSILAALLADAHRYDEAIVEGQASLRLSPGMEANSAVGAALLGRGETQAAIPYLREALRLSPGHPTARFVLVEALIRTGDPAEALSLLRDPIVSRSGNSSTEDTLGLLFVRAGDIEEGLRHLERAIELNPYNAGAHNNLGMASLQIAGREADALLHLREAIRLQPDFVKAHLNLGGVLLGIPGRAEEALPHFEEALRLNPDPVLRQKLDALKLRLATAK